MLKTLRQRLGRNCLWQLAGAVCALLCLGDIAKAAEAQEAVAPDIVLLCDPALVGAMSDVGRLWQKRTHVPIVVRPSASHLLLQQSIHHIRSDFVVVEGNAPETSIMQKDMIRPGTVLSNWRNRLVLATLAPRADEPQPAAVSNFGAIDSGSIAIVDPPMSMAGVDSQKALQGVGLWDAVRKQSAGVANTQDAVFLLMQRKVKFAVVYITDVTKNPALAIAVRFPDASYDAITYWIGQTKASKSPRAAEFEAFVQEPETRQVLRDEGLEVTP